MRYFRVSFALLFSFSIAATLAAQSPSPTIPPSGFTQLAKLTGSDTVHLDFLGASVAISGDGNTVALGIATTSAPGAVYVFTKPASGWTSMTQVAKLTASDGGSNDYVGYSVAISADGKTIVAGAPNAHDYIGAAYVFVKPAGGWTNMTETAELTSSDKIYGTMGNSVAISGDTIVVGSPDESTATNLDGAAYVFVKPAAGWTNMTQTAKLTSSDSNIYSYFGSSVAIDSKTIVVGTIGDERAYVFVEPKSGWTNSTQTAKLTAPATSFSVAIGGNTVVVGNPYATVGSNSEQGAAYVFVEPSGGWTNMNQTATLTASDGAESNEFGYSVAISGHQIFAGSPFATINSNSAQGATYAYLKPSTGWKTTSHFNSKLTASDGASGDEFGWSVSLGAKTVLIGAPGATSQKGAAYLFTP